MNRVFLDMLLIYGHSLDMTNKSKRLAGKSPGDRRSALRG